MDEASSSSRSATSMAEEEVMPSSARLIREDTCSCVVVVLTFWFFVSVTLILGVYGSVSLQLGPYSSLLIAPSPLFVEYIKVEQVDDAKTGPNLYGFYADPRRDVINTWSQSRNIPLPSGYHKEWIYVLNVGSYINISYSVNSSTSSLILIIAEAELYMHDTLKNNKCYTAGREGFAQWLENPSYPNTTLSWNVIHGSGTIQQDILISSNYYVALGNMNSEEVEVHLNLDIKALMYNTTDAYYNCAVASGSCNLKFSFPSSNVAVLTSPGPEQSTTSDIWDVKISYGPRWLTYIAGIGAMTLLMLLVFHLLNDLQCSHANRDRSQNTRSERVPLLSNKDDDLSSLGSSYDSVSGDDEDLEEGLAVGSQEGKPLKDGEYNNHIRRLCAICFDAPRDCFFLPCGHCVACFDCGTRTADMVGTCPICLRNIKKVRKIFTV